MNYFVKVTENGTEKIIIVDSYSQPVPTNPIDTIVNRHIGQTDNPHQTSLQQAVSKQGNTPINGEIQIGSTNDNDMLLRILNSMIVFALNGFSRKTIIDTTGLHHTTHNGFVMDIDDNGVRLYNDNSCITVSFDGTITGLQDSILANSAVTRGYVESLAMGLKPHAPVKVMLEKGTDINTFIAHGSGVGKTLTAVQNGTFQYQGVYFGQGDRIGLRCFGYQRVDAGIYVLTQVGDANNPWVLTRATDFDGSSSFESKQADVLFVQEGTYAKCMFIETERGSEPNTGNLIIDTDLVTWELFHKPQDFIFDQGLLLNGQTVSVKPDTTTGETVIPVSVSSNGVGVQRSLITDIAEAKKQESVQYADAQLQFAKSYADQSIQTIYLQTQTNDQTIQTAAKNYTDQQITALAATIPSGSGSKPMLYPQFFLLNGGTIQNYSDYLYMDNAYRSGNDGGLNSNNCIPFMMPENGYLVGISVFISYVAVAGNYVANSVLSINFEIRQITLASNSTVLAFSLPASSTTDKIGSYGNFPANAAQIAGGTAGLNVPLTQQRLYAVKFIHNASGSPIIASAIRGVVVKLEIRVG